MDNMYDASTDQAQLDKQLKLAQMLRQQALSPIQQQTAGGYVVPISPFEGIAKLAQGYFAGQAENKAQDIQKSMTSERNKRIADLLKNYGKTTTEEQSVETDPYSGKPLYSYTPKTVQATPEQQMAQDWQLSQLDPNFAKLLESRKTREDTQAARLEQIRLTNELKKEQMKNDARPFNQIVYTKDGAFSFDARSREVNPLINPATGKQIMGAQYDPSLQGEISGAKSGAGEIGKETAAAQVKLPQVVATANDLSRHIDELIGSSNGDIKPHPGMYSYLNTGGVAGYIPKTDAADFKSRLEQLTGGTFLQAYNTLRGGGQITEVEGAKATAALNRAKAAQSEEAFKSALRDFQSIVQKGAERAQNAAQGNFQPEPIGQSSSNVVDFGSLK